MQMPISTLNATTPVEQRNTNTMDEQVIEPRSGCAFILRKGQRLKVTDLKGEQVADFLCYSLDDTKEVLSSGRTLDYEETIFLTKGNRLYSNRSNIMAKITRDDVGRHDFLLTPCSKDTFRLIYGHESPHHGCHGNLAMALEAFGIDEDAIPTTFNIFMNVQIEAQTGKISVCPPLSKAGQSLELVAEMDLIVGLTACSAEQSNNYSFKPIAYQIFD